MCANKNLGNLERKVNSWDSRREIQRRRRRLTMREKVREREERKNKLT